MLMPSTASVNADLPARAFFFVNDNDGIPEVPNTRRIFSVAKNSSKGKNLEYVTRDVFLRPGEYRIKIAEGPYVWWKSISVGKEKVLMNLDFLKNASRNITVHFSAMDCETGKDLTKSSQFRIQVGSKWVDASKVDFSKLKTGNVYKFLMIHEGYYDEYFSLLIDWYQDELFITGNMRKK